MPGALFEVEMKNWIWKAAFRFLILVFLSVLHSHSLAPDPALVWNTFMTSWGDQNGNVIAVDKDGDVYVGGGINNGRGTPVNPHNGATGVWDTFAVKIDVFALEGVFRDGFEAGNC